MENKENEEECCNSYYLSLKMELGQLDTYKFVISDKYISSKQDFILYIFFNTMTPQ